MPNLLYGFTQNQTEIVTAPLLEVAASPVPKRKQIQIPFDTSNGVQKFGQN